MDGPGVDASDDTVDGVALNDTMSADTSSSVNLSGLVDDWG